MPDGELRAMVGEDLHALLRDAGPPVVSASLVSSLTSPVWTRATFRLELADGSRWKGRRFESPKSAELAVRLGRCLPDGPFPKIVATRGVALLGEWIEGVVLSSRPMSDDLLRRAGAIQRAVHDIEVAERVLDGPTHYPAAHWHQGFAVKVEGLRRAGNLTLAESEKVLDVARAHVPERTRRGLVHGDLSPENLVIDAHGGLHVVDNDSVDLHTPEFDLARTWYRWPMTSDERTVFEQGYGVREVLASYHTHALHWVLVVLVAAAEFRLRNQLPGASLPLRHLRDVLRDR